MFLQNSSKAHFAPKKVFSFKYFSFCWPTVAASANIPEVLFSVHFLHPFTFSFWVLDFNFCLPLDRGFEPHRTPNLYQYTKLRDTAFYPEIHFFLLFNFKLLELKKLVRQCIIKNQSQWVALHLSWITWKQLNLLKNWLKMKFEITSLLRRCQWPGMLPIQSDPVITGVD